MKKIIYLLIVLMALISCKESTKQENKTPLETQKSTIVTTDKYDFTKFGITVGENPQGLQTGETAPNVNLKMEDGHILSLQSIYEKQPVVLFFYRGYWCPYCSQYLSTLATRAKELEEKGAKLIAITPESYKNITKTKDKTHANFTIVSDDNENIMKAFHVNFDVTQDYQNKLKQGLGTSLDSINTSGAAVLPIPATYVINKQGKIVYSFNNPNYTQRADIDEILSHIPLQK
ncbi:peroxiredoxin-like family protein [Zhouia sp. PK063]|uniref:peroxiredoxin-like family protein n=1 Tax=Zhouia sp. PK063 TaxID=3373602 RepID=UPI0037A488AC